MVAVILLVFFDAGITCFSDDSQELSGVYIPQDLITWWHCEGNTLDAIGRNDCDDNISFDEGYIGKGWRFSHEYYLNSPGHDVNEVEAITIEGWVKSDFLPPNTVMRFMTIVGETDAKAVVRYDGFAGSGTLHFYSGFNGTLRHVYARGVLREGEFQHFAATYNGSIMRLYLNGDLVGENVVKGELQKGLHIIIGSIREPFFGVLDEIRIYGRALNETEIKKIYQSYQVTLPHTLYSFKRLTNQLESYRNVTVGDGYVAWMVKDENEIYFSDGTYVTRFNEGEDFSFNLAINEGRFFWHAWGDWNCSEVFMFDIDEGETFRLTNNSNDEQELSCDGDLIAYSMAMEGSNSEIYLQRISNGLVTRLTNNSYPDKEPHLWGDIVAWTGYYGELESSGDGEGYGEVYYCNVSSGSVFRLMDDDITDKVLDVEEGKILFSRRDLFDILYLYDIRSGESYNISDIDSMPTEFPMISDGFVTWSGRNPSYPYFDSEIYLYDIETNKKQVVTVNAVEDIHPSYSSGELVWQGYTDNDYEIYRYDPESERIIQLTFNNESDHDPIISDGIVVWAVWDGLDEEIMTAFPFVMAEDTLHTEPEIVGTIDIPSPEEPLKDDGDTGTSEFWQSTEFLMLVVLIFVALGIVFLRKTRSFSI